MMNYYATEIKDLSLKELNKINDESDFDSFEQLRLSYPLIFIEEGNSIIFFNIQVKLDKIRYDFLYHLVQNATELKGQKGLSPTDLYGYLGCKRIKNKRELSECELANERMRSIKQKIKNKIKKEYEEFKKQQAKKIKEVEAYNKSPEMQLKKIEDSVFLNEEEKEKIISKLKSGKCEYKIEVNSFKKNNPTGVWEVKSDYGREKYFGSGIPIDSDSPYSFPFDLDTELERLIINKSKKYTTEFIFKEK